MLRAHGTLINEAASGLVQRLGHLRMAGPVQINNALAGLTMEVIGGAAFGWVLHQYPSHALPLVLHPPVVCFAIDIMISLISCTVCCCCALLGHACFALNLKLKFTEADALAWPGSHDTSFCSAVV